MRQCDLGQHFAQARADPLLEFRIGVGVQQGDRHRLGAACHDFLRQRRDLVIAWFAQHRAVAVATRGDLETQVRRHLRRRLGRQVEAVEVAPVLAPDGEGIAEAFRGNQRDLGQAALDDGIGDRGGAVD